MSETLHGRKSIPVENRYADPRVAREFRRRCEAIIRQLQIPAPFDEWSFCATLGEQRRRPLLLQAWPLRQTINDEDIVSGFVQVEQDRDVIFFERDTRRLHQQQIIAHEASHLILRHQGEGITADDLISQLRELAPHNIIRHVHRRARARSPEEFEAETLGRMILLRAHSASAQLAARHPHAAQLLDMLDRLEGRDG